MASEQLAHWYTSHTTVHTGLVYGGSTTISWMIYEVYYSVQRKEYSLAA